MLGGASEGLGQIAAMLATPNGEVVLVESDFPSVTYPWLGAQMRMGMRIRWVADAAATSLTEQIIEAVSRDTSVVCFSAVQYATGTSVDVRSVVERAAEVSARVVVDVTQLAGAAPHEHASGHSQITLTLSTYSHVVPELAHEAAKRMADALWDGPEEDATGDAERLAARLAARTGKKGDGRKSFTLLTWEKHGAPVDLRKEHGAPRGT